MTVQEYNITGRGSHMISVISISPLNNGMESWHGQTEYTEEPFPFVYLHSEKENLSRDEVLAAIRSSEALKDELNGPFAYFDFSKPISIDELVSSVKGKRCFMIHQSDFDDAILSQSHHRLRRDIMVLGD